MSGKNSETTRLVATWMRRELVALADAARWRIKRNRSQFIREAVAEKLFRMGYEVPPEMIYGDDEVDDPLNLTEASEDEREGLRVTTAYEVPLEPGELDPARVAEAVEVFQALAKKQAGAVTKAAKKRSRKAPKKK